jgi:hypothetical protein
VRDELTLLHALYGGVPAAFVLGLIALAASRRARLAQLRHVEPRGRGTARLGRALAWLGLYAGVTGGIALGVYGVLVWAQ